MCVRYFVKMELPQVENNLEQPSPIAIIITLFARLCGKIYCSLIELNSNQTSSGGPKPRTEAFI